MDRVASGLTSALMILAALSRWLLAVSLPALSIAVEFLTGFNTSSGLITAAVTLAVAAVWVLVAIAGPNRGTTLVSGFLAFLAWVAVAFGVETWVLDARGVTTTCILASVHAHDETGLGSPEDGGGVTMTMYDYRLNCPAGGPDAMFSRGEAIGDPGQQVEVVYDPRGVARPLVRQQLGGGDIYVVFLVVSLGLAELVGAVGGLVGEVDRRSTTK